MGFLLTVVGCTLRCKCSQDCRMPINAALMWTRYMHERDAAYVSILQCTIGWLFCSLLCCDWYNSVHMQSNCFEVQWRSQDLEVGGHHRRKLPPNSGGAHGPFLPLPFPLIPSPLLPSPPSLSLSLEVGPQIQLGGLGQSPSRNRIWCILALYPSSGGNNFNDFRRSQPNLRWQISQ